MSGSVSGSGAVGPAYGPLPAAFRPGVFPREYIARGETLFYETRPSFAAYFAGRITAFLFFFVVFFLYPLSVLDPYFTPEGRLLVAAFLFLFFVLPSLIGLIVGVLRWVMTAFAITDRRILASRGVLSRNLVECPFEKIQNVTMRQGIFARVFGYGHLAFATAGISGTRERHVLRGGGVFWRGVKDPVNTRRYVEEVREVVARTRKTEEFEEMARVLQRSGGAAPLGPAARPGFGPMPSASAAAAPVAGTGVAARTQDQIAQLEQAIRQQKDLLFMLDQGLAQGRVDNQAYTEISQRRSQEIADLERKLAQQRAQLGPGGSGGDQQR